MPRALRSQRVVLESKPESTTSTRSRPPLKDASQNASQRSSTAYKPIATGMSVDTAMDDSDDEMLLSPTKPKPNAKRPPSPGDGHGHTSDVHGGRVAKRFKLDPLPDLPAALKAKQTVGSIDITSQRRSHKRNFSAPSTTDARRKTRSRSSTIVTKPSALPDTSSTKRPKSTRAQSVPLTTAKAYVFPDFTNIRPSPWRALSKERESRFNQIVATRLDSILDLETENAPPGSGDQAQEDLGASMEVDEPSTLGESAAITPQTPRPNSAGLPPPSSPLTPVPPTPVPTATNPPDNTEPQMASLDASSSSQPAPSAPIAATRTSKLPRPSVGMGPPVLPLQTRSQSQSTQTKRPPSKAASSKSKSALSEASQKKIDTFFPKVPAAPAITTTKSLPQPTAGSSKANGIVAALASAVAPLSLAEPPKTKLTSKMKKREKPTTSYTAIPEAPTTVTRTTQVKKPSKKWGIRKEGEKEKVEEEVKEKEQGQEGKRKDANLQVQGGLQVNTLPMDVDVAPPTDTEQFASVSVPPSTKRLSFIPAPSPKKTFTFQIPPSSPIPKAHSSSNTKTKTTTGIFSKPVPSTPKPEPKANMELDQGQELEIPGSPMLLSSPAAKPVSAAASPTKPTAPLSFSPGHKRTRSNPNSPTKPLVPLRSASLSRAGPSSLSTLSDALEKLTRAAPSKPNTGRPSTSMGFSRDIPGDDEDEGEIQMMRSATTEDFPKPGLTKALVRASLSRPLEPTGDKDKKPSGLALPSKNFAKNGTIPSWMSNAGLKGGASKIFMPGNGNAGVSTFKGLGLAGGRLGQKASKKSALPSVMASPVKGGEGGEFVEGSAEDEWAQIAAIRREGQSLAAKFLAEDNEEAVEQEDATKEQGKNAANAWKKNASRRASLALQGLSQSINTLPAPSEKEKTLGLMGPPATPTKLTTSTSLPSGLSSSATKATGLPVRSSSRIAASQQTAPAALGKIKGGADGHVSSSRKAKEDGKEESAAALKILKDCKVFVDVRTDDGDDAGSLFVEMLDSLGAKVLTRVGQTCTHIVYKNGLLSTQSRFRMLREPKPLVVGITWVVECAEQMKRVDESSYSIDLESINVAGVKSRRRSMLPKTFYQNPDDTMPVEDDNGDGDSSVEGSSSTVLDGLAPLERARRRQSLMVS